MNCKDNTPHIEKETQHVLSDLLHAKAGSQYVGVDNWLEGNSSQSIKNHGFASFHCNSDKNSTPNHETSTVKLCVESTEPRTFTLQCLSWVSAKKARAGFNVTLMLNSWTKKSIKPVAVQLARGLGNITRAPSSECKPVPGDTW